MGTTISIIIGAIGFAKVFLDISNKFYFLEVRTNQDEENKQGLDVTIFIENLITNNLKIKRSNEKKNICK